MARTQRKGESLIWDKNRLGVEELGWRRDARKLSLHRGRQAAYIYIYIYIYIHVLCLLGWLAKPC